jgi:hypothetical protein
VARCNCGTASCSCVIKGAPSGGVVVTGSGSPTRPYYISLIGGEDPLDDLDVSSTPSLQLTIARPEETTNKTVIYGTATPTLAELRDVLSTDTPVNGDVPTWNDDHWEFRTPAAGGGGGAGAIFTGNGITGDGSAGLPVVARNSGTWGSGLLGLYGAGASNNGSLGTPVYIDQAGLLRSQPQVISGGSGKTNAALPSSYPLGMSVLSVYTADATSGGWPLGVSAEVLTLIRHDIPVSAGWQIWSRNTATATATEMMFRTGTDGTGWSPWVSFAKPVAHASRHKGTSQALTAASTYYTILWDSQEVATNLTYSNGIFTIQTPGLYQINCCALYQGSVSCQLRLRIMAGGVGVVEAVQQVVGPIVNNAITAGRLLRLAAGDTVYAQGISSATGFTVTGSSLSYSYMGLALVAP